MKLTELKPTERLEAEICELAGNIAAATARLVLLIAEYDRRQGWAEWGCKSCVHWLSWKCAIGAHAAREKLRVGHALEALPVVRAAFEHGELSYSQVRAITRIAGPHNEEGLVGIARAATAQQLERLVAATDLAHKTRDRGFAAAQLDKRHFTPGTDYDNAMFIADTRLPADDGRLLTKALEAAAKQLRDERGSESPPQTREQLLADALMLLAQSYLATGPASRNGGDDYRAVIHADADLVEAPIEATSNAPVGTDAPRCHLERGQMITQATIERIWCDTAASRVVVRDGTLEIETDSTRTISGALRRALRLRDKHCRFPGCSSVRADAHHVRWRSKGGPTILDNLILLCRFHHRLVHEYGYQVCSGPDGEIRFYDVQGRQLHNRSALVDAAPRRDLSLVNAEHGVAVDALTISPQWCGDRLDLAYAVSTLLPPERPRGDVSTLLPPERPRGDVATAVPQPEVPRGNVASANAPERPRGDVATAVPQPEYARGNVASANAPERPRGDAARPPERPRGDVGTPVQPERPRGDVPSAPPEPNPLN